MQGKEIKATVAEPQKKRYAGLPKPVEPQGNGRKKNAKKPSTSISDTNGLLPPHR
jgi:hypothetical protein